MTRTLPPRHLSPWERVEWYGWHVSTSGCWVFNGPLDTKGYGRVKVRGATLKAHRASFEANVRLLNSGEVVRHICDNPPCVNPGHLLPGSLADNTRDRDLRGRTARSPGELNPQAKLTWDQVRDIRASDLTPRELSRRLGVSASNIGTIKRGRTWIE